MFIRRAIHGMVQRMLNEDGLCKKIKSCAVIDRQIDARIRNICCANVFCTVSPRSTTIFLQTLHDNHRLVETCIDDRWLRLLS